MQPTFYVGQIVRPKQHVPARSNSRPYCIVSVLPSQDGIPAYLIKNMVGVEKIIKQHEIEPASDKTLP